MTTSVYATGSNLFGNILNNNEQPVLLPTSLGNEIIDVISASFSQTICRLDNGGFTSFGLPVELEEMMLSTLFGQDNFTGYISAIGRLVPLENSITSIESSSSYKFVTMNGKGEIIAVLVSNEVHFFTSIHSLTSPVILDFKPPSSIIKIVSGASHFLLLTSSSVFSFGDNRFGQCGISPVSSHNKSNPLTINAIEFFDGLYPRQIIAGDFHSAVIAEDGGMYMFGSDSDGQCGRFGGFEPTLIEFGEKVEGAEDVEEVEEVALGSAHSVVRMKDGKVWVTGLNQAGQLGLGDVESRKTFILLPFSQTHKILTVVCSRWNTLFITEREP